MEIESFIRDFAEMFEDTDSSAIQANTNYQELDEWSSLIAMSIVAMVRTKYGKAVTGKEIRSCETVEELFNLITTK
ncbi:acyl carrier protein [Fibrobacter sp.]